MSRNALRCTEYAVSLKLAGILSWLLKLPKWLSASSAAVVFLVCVWPSRYSANLGIMPFLPSNSHRGAR